MNPVTRNRIGANVILAGAILVLGLGVNLGFTQPQERRLSRAAAERGRLLGRLETMEAADLLSRELAAGFGAENLESALRAQGRTDLVGFLSGMLERSGLSRLEMSTLSTSEENGFRRTRFYLHLSGSYAAAVGFVKELEGAQRPAVVESLVFEQPADAAALDVRIELSVYELLGGTGS